MISPLKAPGTTPSATPVQVPLVGTSETTNLSQNAQIGEPTEPRRQSVPFLNDSKSPHSAESSRAGAKRKLEPLQPDLDSKSWTPKLNRHEADKILKILKDYGASEHNLLRAWPSRDAENLDDVRNVLTKVEPSTVLDGVDGLQSRLWLGMARFAKMKSELRAIVARDAPKVDDKLSGEQAKQLWVTACARWHLESESDRDAFKKLANQMAGNSGPPRNVEELLTGLGAQRARDLLDAVNTALFDRAVFKPPGGKEVTRAIAHEIFRDFRLTFGKMNDFSVHMIESKLAYGSDRESPEWYADPRSLMLGKHAESVIDPFARLLVPGKQELAFKEELRNKLDLKSGHPPRLILKEVDNLLSILQTYGVSADALLGGSRPIVKKPWPKMTLGDLRLELTQVEPSAVLDTVDGLQSTLALGMARFAKMRSELHAVLSRGAFKVDDKLSAQQATQLWTIARIRWNLMSPSDVEAFKALANQMAGNSGPPRNVEELLTGLGAQRARDLLDAVNTALFDIAVFKPPGGKEVTHAIANELYRDFHRMVGEIKPRELRLIESKLAENSDCDSPEWYMDLRSLLLGKPVDSARRTLEGLVDMLAPLERLALRRDLGRLGLSEQQVKADNDSLFVSLAKAEAHASSTSLKDDTKAGQTLRAQLLDDVMSRHGEQRRRVLVLKTGSVDKDWEDIEERLVSGLTDDGGSRLEDLKISRYLHGSSTLLPEVSDKCGRVDDISIYARIRKRPVAYLSATGAGRTLGLCDAKGTTTHYKTVQELDVAIGRLVKAGAAAPLYIVNRRDNHFNHFNWAVRASVSAPDVDHAPGSASKKDVDPKAEKSEES